jgi:hypothetical protein
MINPPDFERLLEVVELIARHPNFPGKRQATERCRAEIEELLERGWITGTQRDQLRAILAPCCEGCCPVAS